MTRAVIFLLLATAVFAQAETVREVVQFVKSSVELKYKDADVAKTLRGMKLTEKLDDKAVEQLQALGAGPKTMAALREMVDASAKLAEPAPLSTAPPPALPPPPDSVQQGKIIETAREYALNYTKQLPNYLCLEVVHRAFDPRINDAPGNEDWRNSDTVALRLSYYDQKEDYKVVSRNNQATVGDKSFEQLGGVVSQGEFGTMLKQIFSPESEARFEWDHLGTLRGRRMYVFAYDIDQPHSRFSIIWEKTDKIVPAYRGKVYIDADTNMIMRVTQVPYDMPSTFPVRASEEILDYDFQKIGESEFLLPLKVKMTSRTTKYLSKNDIEFRLYQKYSADAVIKFDESPPPLPEDKVKDKP